jgi:hypothetical protein
MRKLALILLLLLIPLALASNFKDLKAGESIEDEGWNVTVVRIYNDNSVLLQAYLDSDRITTKKLDLGENYTFEGININITEVFYDPDPNLSIVDLSTEIIFRNSCDKDSDCDDSDSCTTDQCIGYPRSCDYDNSHINITNCISGDGCCQSGCKWVNDKDCEQHPCERDVDCNDHDVSTNDTCASNSTCNFQEIIACISEDKYCPDGCIYTSKLENRDLDCSPDSACKSHIDCNDNNDSTIDFCTAEPSTNPKKCTYEEIIITISEKDEDINTSKSEIEYTAPPTATEKKIEEVLEKMPLLKNPTVLALISIIIIAYVLIVFYKYKPAKPLVYGTH